MNNMMIGKGIVSVTRTTYTKGNRHVTRITFKKADGTDAGSISISKTLQQKKKRLQYNFKQISNMILSTKTSTGAGRVVTKARANVAMLQRKLKLGDYDDQELQSAIVHAKKLERIAKKKMRHLKEEEKAKRQGECVDDMEEKPEELSEDSRAEAENANEDREQEQEMTQEELKELMRQMQRLMEETIQEMDEITELEELSDELIGSAPKHMDKEDLERLKKKHRLDEMREIVEADMKYLKDLFGRLEREKQAASSGSGGAGNSGSSGDYSNTSGVSLELSDMPVPVQAAEAPVPAEGGTIDLSV